MQVGDTFFLGNEKNNRLHMYVILSRPDARGRVLCVSFRSSYPKFADKACVVIPGQYNHPFFRHESFADYSYAREIDIEIIRVNVNGHRWPRSDRIPEGLVRALQEGARHSAFLAVKFRRFCDLF